MYGWRSIDREQRGIHVVDDADGDDEPGFGNHLLFMSVFLFDRRRLPRCLYLLLHTTKVHLCLCVKGGIFRLCQDQATAKCSTQ